MVKKYLIFLLLLSASIVFGESPIMWKGIVKPTNTKPIAQDDYCSTPEDVVLSFNVIDNDTDPEGGLTINTTPLISVGHGTLFLSIDGSFIYTPDADYFGSDGFTYIVCDDGSPALCDTAQVFITVTPVNDPPVAFDDFYSTLEDIPLVGSSVKANDVDLETGLAVLTTPLVGVGAGTLTLFADGKFYYVPNPNFYGQDSFVYRVCDGGTVYLCDTATAFIEVVPVNDKPIATIDTFSTAEDIPLNGNGLLDNDIDLETELLVTENPVMPVSQGTLILNSDGSFLYSPDLNFYGQDSFKYEVCDLGFPSICDTALVELTVTPVNDDPLAGDDYYITPTSTPITSVNVTDNDIDVDVETLVVAETPLSGPFFGTLELNADGTFVYTPIVNFNGVDSFEYIVCDPALACDTAQVVMKVGQIEAFILTPDTIDCYSPVLALDGTNSSQGAAFSYTWTTTNGHVVGSNIGQTISVDEAGEYTLSVMDTISSFLSTWTVTVVADTVLPNSEIYLPHGNLTCIDTFVTLTGKGGGIDQVANWQTSNGNIVELVSDTIVKVDMPGVYEYQVVDTKNGCVAIATTIVAIDTISPIAQVVTPSTPITCANPCLELDGSSSSSGIAYSYTWTTTLGTIQFGQTTTNPTVCAGGEYELQVTNTDNGCVAQTAIVIEENTVLPLLTMQANLAITCTVNQVPISVSSTGGSGDYSFDWSPVSSIVSGLQSANPVVQEGGWYLVTVTDNETGCSDTASILVDAFIDAPIVTIPISDTLTCIDTMVVLDADYDASFLINWTTITGKTESDVTAASVWVSQTGEYTATVTNPVTGCFSIQNIEVVASTDKPLALANDMQKVDCETNNTLLGDVSNAEMEAVVFEWSTENGHFLSATDLPNPIVDMQGLYSLKVINPATGCFSEDEILVEDIDPLLGATLNLAMPTCLGQLGSIEIIDVKGSSAPFLYSFDGGLHFGTDSIRLGLAEGTYEIVVQDEIGCEYPETVVLQKPNHSGITMQPDTRILLGDSLLLQVFSEFLGAIENVKWEPAVDTACVNCLSQMVKPMMTTTYSVTVQDTSGCISEAHASIYVAQPNVFIPNIFSPDGNGKNDRLLVFGDVRRFDEVVRMEVYDRWGSLVFVNEHFQLNDDSAGWDGTHFGERVLPGVYLYTVKLKSIDGRVVFLQGDVTILE